MTLNDFVEALNRNSKMTAHDYGGQITRFSRVIDKTPDDIVSEIRDGRLDQIEFFRKLNSWSGTQKHRATTTANYFASWIMFLRYEKIKVDRDEIRDQVRPPKKHKSFGARPFTRQQLTHVLDLVNHKYRTMILLAATSGMRGGEIGALRVRDLDFEKSPTEVFVRGETSKSGRDRITFCSDEATTHLKSFIGPDRDKNDYVFTMQDGHPFSSTAIASATSRFLERSKMRDKNGDDRRHALSFHSLRKFFTTAMVEAGVPLPIVELLCGREIGTTQSYLMPSPDKMREYYANTMQKTLLTQVPVDFQKVVDSRIAERDAVIQQLQERLTKLEKVYTKKMEVTAD